MEEFGKTKVCKFDVSTLVHKDIFGLKISMDNLVGMEVSESNKNLCTDEPDRIFRESPFLAQVIKDISTSYKLEEEINSKLILKHVVKGKDEWVFGLLENVPLGLGVQNLTFFNKDVFINPFHSIFFSIFSVHNQKHFSK